LFRFLDVLASTFSSVFLFFDIDVFSPFFLGFFALLLHFEFAFSCTLKKTTR
jgi:arginyl-tRNA--protein-N-Asp/Glu arginylyltransferase